MVKELVCRKCGLINAYKIVKNGHHHTAYCDCGAYIKNVAYDVPKIYFGKYKGVPIAEINDAPYLEWFLNNIEKLSESARENIKKQLSKLRGEWTDATEDKDQYK